MKIKNQKKALVSVGMRRTKFVENKSEKYKK